MTRDDLARMSRDELIDLVLAEYTKLQELQAEVEALRLKIEKNKKPPTNSSNSSQPPSRDQKVNLPKEDKRHRHGPPKGHVKYERKLVAEPDHVVEVKPEVCEHCQADLREEGSELVNVNQITELPEAQAEVIEVRQYATECPCCGQEQVGQPPEGLEMGRSFGARLEGAVMREAVTDARPAWQPCFRDDQQKELTPGQVQRAALRYLLQLGTPARSPRLTGKGTGRAKGYRPNPRTRFPVIKKAKTGQNQATASP